MTSHRKVVAKLSGHRRRKARVEVHIRNHGGGDITLEISKGARDSAADLFLNLRLDEARELLRALQASCDREHERQRHQAKSVRELDQLLEGIPTEG